MLVVLFLLLAGAFANGQQSVIVEIDQGPVRGFKNSEYDVNVFKNIPYATVPKGRDKFKAPLPPPVWLEPLEDLDEVVCPQESNDLFPKTGVTREDCLVATVYTPDTTEVNLPVLVHVHGGAFVIGYGNSMTPEPLVSSKKVVAVMFNYRIGAHGFLCLGTDSIPGNAGMKDQVALLRWVKKNIAYFGGNPNDVTIAGHSAGSCSVDLLMLSKSTKGLFNKVSPESGANIAAFSIQPDPIKNAKEYGELLGFQDVHNLTALEEFFKNISINRLNEGDTLKRPDSTFLFAPCVEAPTNEESFLENDPVRILKSGQYEKIPMLYGFTNMDGLFRINLFDEWKNDMNDNFSDFLPADLQFEDEIQKCDVAEKVKMFYFGNSEIDNDSVLGFVDYFTDVLFAYPVLRSIKLQLEAGNNEIYLYEYSFIDDNTPYVPYTKVRGAGHIAQTTAVLNSFKFTGIDPNSISSEYRKMRDTMKDIWLNFITTGKPVSEDIEIPDWPPVRMGSSPYMSLNQTSILRCSLLKDRFELWDEIYEKYYLRPVPPVKPIPRI